MKRSDLMRVLSAALLVASMSLPAFAQPAGNPPLSNSDENAVMGWIAGRVSAKQQPYCYKQSYGRGVGVPLSTCPAGQEKNGLICYPDCKASYGGVGPVCWQGCPSGYVDTGALCHIDKALTTGGSWECTKRKWGVCWWKAHRCPSGYTNAGAFCALNTPSVPAGYKGLTGLDIEKNSYGRGAGYPMDCKTGQQEDAGLCYKYCNTGYSGVGPVCWQGCTEGRIECGVGCATSKNNCASNTANMVLSPVVMVGTIAADVFTAGAAGEAEAGAKTAAQTGAEDGAKAGEEAAAAAKAGKSMSKLDQVKAAWKEYKLERQVAGAALKYAKVVKMWVDSATSSFAQLTTPEVTATLNAKFAGHPKALLWVEQQYAMQNLTLMLSQSEGDTAQSIQGGLSIAGGFDPTGVTSTIAAYTNPKCNNADAFPNVKLLY